MRLTEYEKNVRREVDQWQRADTSLVMQAVNLAMKPVDMLVERISPQVIDQAGDAVQSFLSMLNDASHWTYDAQETISAAKRRNIDVSSISELRSQPLELLDPLARSYFTENALMAAVEGGGTGLGGALLIVADVPLLFTINFRLIQQIAAAYGFVLREPSNRPLVLAVFNVAASDSRDARADALREISVAAAAFASGQEYKGRISGTFRDQNRHIPREIAKNLVGRKIGQLIPLAGAAVGAGVNYWFTSQTAEAAYMLFRALFVECKERS